MQQATTRHNGTVAPRSPPSCVAAETSANGKMQNAVLPSRAAPLVPPFSQNYAPLPVNSLMQMVDTLPAAAPPGLCQSDAMLRAMHDYMSNALPDTFQSDPMATFSTDAIGLSQLAMPFPSTPVFAAAPPLAPVTNGAAPAGVPRATAATMLKASQRMATALQKLQPALNSPLPRNGCSPPVAACADDADGFAKCWAQHLSQIQAMLAEGLPEADAAFVSKLASELLASQPVDSSGPLRAPPPPPPFAAGTPPPSVLPATIDAHDTNASPVQDGTDAHACGFEKGTADLGDGAAPAAEPPVPAKRAPFVTEKVLPFIERPYRLLQSLHASAERSASNSERTHCDGSIEAQCSPPLDGLHAVAASKSDSDSAAAGTAELSPGAWPELFVQGDDDGTPARPAAQTETKSTASLDSSASASEPADGAGGVKQAAPPQVGSDGDGISAQDSRKPPLQSGAAGWRSVLQRLVTAGPQAVPPGSPFRPGSSGGWASTQSSTEPDTVSFRSEDVFGVDGASARAGTVSSTVTASTKPAKKKRAKKARGAQR